MIDVDRQNMLMIVHKEIEGEHIINKSCFCKPILIEICDDLTADELQNELNKECTILQ